MNELSEMNLFQFANPEYLWAFFSIVFLILIYIFAYYRKRKALAIFGDHNIIRRLMPDASKTRVLIKFVTLNLVLAMVIIAAARPQFGKKLKEVTRQSAEIIIALDVSNSMEAEDIDPNRLIRAKRAISKFLKKSQDDIGLIIFAGKAYMQVPLTNDYSAIKLVLEPLSTDNVSIQGTDISAAVELGIKSFSPTRDKGKALIIITDGENHEEKAIENAKEAKEKGIIVSTIGMGKLKAVPIPNKKTRDFRKNNSGDKVLTKLNEKLLRQIASTGGGIYARGNNIDTGLKLILKELNKLEKKETKSKFKEYNDKFHYIIFIALFFIIVEFIILEKKNKKLNKLIKDLF